MKHKARLDRSRPEIGAIITIAGSRLIVGDTLVLDFQGGGEEWLVKAFGLGRLVLDVGDTVLELRPWHSGDGPATTLGGPSSTWTVSGIPNHTRPAI